jgi:hypothetical protein
VGKNSAAEHEAFVLAYADSAAARILSHLSIPLEPRQTAAFSAIFEIPEAVTQVSLAVADSTAARSARARIALDDIEPVAVLTTGAATRDLWEVIDRRGPVTLGTMCSATTQFPAIRQKLIDRVREVRAVESELE